ncbi:uncharacterized protein LOC112692591 [Sipha flava]|uniref:Uncharacterized protein LOC112692591 n=1 Tax=Sipha flava TaxID=143950 RepID=A0A2S2QIA9_9HEMI|nr:uncharacterized protein LOC112692591 [Sipha flava]
MNQNMKNITNHSQKIKSDRVNKLPSKSKGSQDFQRNYPRRTRLTNVPQIIKVQIPLSKNLKTKCFSSSSGIKIEYPSGSDAVVTPRVSVKSSRSKYIHDVEDQTSTLQPPLSEFDKKLVKSEAHSHGNANDISSTCHKKAGYSAAYEDLVIYACERHRNRSLSPFGSETQESLGSIDLTLTPTSSPDRSRSRSRSTEHSTAESTKFAELADFKDLLTVAKRYHFIRHYQTRSKTAAEKLMLESATKKRVGSK